MFEDCSVLLGALVFNSLYPLTRPVFGGLLYVVSAVVIAVVVLPALAATLRMGNNKVRPEKEQENGNAS